MYSSRRVMHSKVFWSGESGTVRHLAGESCTVKYPGPESHAQQGTLTWGVMHSETSGRGGMGSEVSWPGESCAVKYPGPGSHAQ